MPVNRGEAVIMALLSQLPHGVGRTKLVKLVYLVDNMRAEHIGRPLTGFNYFWDNYGPNAKGNLIVATLDDMERRGLIYQKQGTTPHGGPRYHYTLSPDVTAEDLPLEPDEWMFIRSIVNAYGELNTEAVVKASKKTAPMQNVAQGDALRLKKDPAIEERQAKILSNVALMEQIDRSLQSPQGGITLEELKAHYAQ